MYWKLKTRALEETLTEISFYEDTDENIVPNNSFPDSFSLSDTTLSSNQSHDNSKVLAQLNTIEPESNCSQENLTKDKVPTSTNSTPIDEVNVEGAWGNHLNFKKDNKLDQEKTLQKTTSFQLSQNKFKSSKFLKRNPRKSASFSKLQSKSKEDLTQDIEQVEKNDSKQECDIDTSDIFDASQSESLKVINLEKKVSTQSVNTSQQLIGKPTLTYNRQLNSGWLSRCAGDVPDESKSQPERLSNHSDSGIDTMESTHSSNDNLSLRNSLPDKVFSDEEDYVCNSDSEEERKKRIRNFNKIISDSDLNPSKKFCSNNTNSINEEKVKNISPKSLMEVQEPLPLSNNVQTLSVVTESINVDAESLDNQKPVKERKFFKRKLPIVAATVSKKPSIDSIPPCDNESKLPSGEVDKNATYSRKKNSKTQPVKKQKIQKSTTRKKLNKGNEAQNEKSENEEQPLYSIESLDVVPRLISNAESTGNLIADFSRVLEPSNSETLVTDSNKKSEEKMPTNNLHANNYVRINLKKKVFVRGKKTFNYAKYKKNLWKQRKKELSSGEGSLEIADLMEKNGMKCFKCKETGHFSRQCPNSKEDSLISLEVASGISDFPTLEEAEQMAKLKRPYQSQNIQPRSESSRQEEKEEDDEEETNLDGFDFSDWEDVSAVNYERLFF